MTFKENEKGYYIPKIVDENDFLNEKNSPADLAKFGKTYSVLFEGDAETFLWTTKTEPEVGKKYYGHIQKTSGKMMRFKVDKLEDGSFSTGPSTEWKPKDERQITRNMVWKNLLGFYDVQSLTPDSTQWQHFWGMVDLHTDNLLPIAQGETSHSPPPVKEAEPIAERSLKSAWEERDKLPQKAIPWMNDEPLPDERDRPYEE